MGSVFSVFGYCHWRSWAGNLKLESEFLQLLCLRFLPVLLVLLVFVSEGF